MDILEASVHTNDVTIAIFPRHQLYWVPAQYLWVV